MLRSASLLIVLAVLALGCSPVASVSDADEALAAQADSPAFDPLDEQRLMDALRYLASDDLLGRRTGTPGIDSAAVFLKRRFEAAGLASAPGAEDFYQTIPFAFARQPLSLSVSVSDRTWESDEAVLLRGSELVMDAAVAFVGYGADASDYAGAVGKLAVAQAGTPGGGVADALGMAADKRALAAEAGAAGLIELYALPVPWARIAGFLKRERLAVQDGPDLLHAWVPDAEGALAVSLADTPEAGGAIATSGLRMDAAVSSNVAGFVEGRDPALKDEVVVLVAHYDHVGAGMTNGRGATPADSIFNGARDNGMGTVALLAAAEALAQERPRRSVLALAVTAEEEGLLGSRYYVENPLIPLQETVFALNTDGAGYSVTDRVSIVGLGRTSVDPLLEAAAAEAGLDLGSDPAPEQGLFDRSDNVNFARAGVPTLTFSPGLDSFQSPAIAQYYHNAADQVDGAFDAAYFQQYVTAFVAAAKRIANADRRPTWTPGDEYADEGAALYGGE
ncbi:MAG: M28 family peptidase [Bacteroidota bacterium]